MYLKLLRENVRQGVINLYLPGGRQYRFGDSGLEAHWRVNNEQTMHKIARDWEFQLGETYMNGEWEVAQGELRDLLCVLRANFAEYRISRWIQPLARLIQQWNKLQQSRRNASHHYDLDEHFFRMFLDSELHYSCAYFSDGEKSLEQAQQQKCRHVAAKLLLEKDQRVLDIGCGWGGMAFYLAQNFDVEVTGITLSGEQLQVARRRAQELALDNVHFELLDYRQLQGRYDRIVSIGMFEHVGKPNYDSYFGKLGQLLAADGVALIHSIGVSGAAGITNPWIRKHIFPGGSLPSLSQMMESVEKVPLMLTDVEVLRLHYARTLSAWTDNLHNNRERVCQQLGERFYRMWEFYLAISEISFQYSDSVVFQLQLARQHDVVPVTRDYLYKKGASVKAPAIERLKLVG